MYKGVIKRVLPFFLTFAGGLLVASFFVSVTAPNFAFGGRGVRFSRCERMQSDYYDLKRENERLQRELDAARQNPVNFDFDGLNDAVPAVPVAPPPPPAPRVRVAR